MGSVVGLGYVVINASDLDAWESFGSGLLGMQIAERTPDRLLLRLDDRAYRFDIRRDPSDAVETLGWEVQTAADLEAAAQRLEGAGYAVKRADAGEAKSRLVSDLIAFQDANGVTVEVFYGMRRTAEPWASPTGATFVTGDQGLGHAMQVVGDFDTHWQLYVDLLGFRLSDYIDIEAGNLPDGGFLHCNPRHHSMAFGVLPGVSPRIGHIMVEVEDIDTLGRAYDRVVNGEAELRSTLGRHSNDKMISFYVKSPSNFEIEYGWHGLRVDDATWTPGRWTTPHLWGHRRQVPHPDL